jgi:hypothetical protein
MQQRLRGVLLARITRTLSAACDPSFAVSHKNDTGTDALATQPCERMARVRGHGAAAEHHLPPCFPHKYWNSA